MSHYYKKTQLQQLKAFCKLAEYENIGDVAKSLNSSISTISMQISSLEDDLGIKLFDRNSNGLKLNNKGKQYYKTALKILSEVDKFYHKKKMPQISQLNILTSKVRRFSTRFNRFLLKIIKKIVIKVSVKHLIYIFILFISSIFLYLHNTNYFFDKRLKGLSGSTLKQVIQDSHYRIDKNIPCSADATRFCMDIGELVINLLSKNYDISTTLVKMTEYPSGPMRMNDNILTNELFNNDKEIKCDRERRFEWMKTRSANKFTILNKSKKSRFYIFYEKSNGTNHNVFLENVTKYSDQLFGIQLKDKTNISKGTYWIIKYRYYYYMFYETNGVQQHQQDEADERYLIFKKLTLKELMEYDHGSYWKLIKDYNIKIG